VGADRAGTSALDTGVSGPANPTGEAPAAGGGGAERDPGRTGHAQTAAAGTEEAARDGVDTDGRRSWPTEWAGLLFVLGAAPDAGIPQRLLTDPVLAERPLSWLLTELGRLLLPGCPATDPALAALAGLDPAAVTRTLPAAPGEVRSLQAHALRWATAVRQRLDRPGQDAGEVLDWLARRPGRLLIEPGWTDLILPLEAVDLDIRRAGLDIDPGWLPWLGRVVRYRYE
jgi:hypothetical protein